MKWEWLKNKLALWRSIIKFEEKDVNVGNKLSDNATYNFQGSMDFRGLNGDLFALLCLNQRGVANNFFTLKIKVKGSEEKRQC